jgi:pimeloyl-ACP methyl ester carboxylesterase
MTSTLDTASLTDLDREAEAMLARMRPRRRAAPRLAAALASVERHDVATPHGRVAAWRIGEGPAVLMVHGWEDDNSLWEPAIERFAAAGHAVVVLDLPGHGFAEADDANYRVAADAIVAVAAALGPVDALLTHSYGGAVSVAAIEAGLSVRRAVLIAATVPLRMAVINHDLMPPAIRPVHRRAGEIYEARHGRSMALFDFEAAAPCMRAQALFIHSIDDEYPAANAERLAALWPGARMLLVDGLGHRPVARDRDIIGRALRFIEEGR